MALTTEQLNEIIENYCDRVVDEMDTKSMEQMIYEMLVDPFQQSDEEYWQELVKSTEVD